MSGLRCAGDDGGPEFPCTEAVTRLLVAAGDALGDPGNVLTCSWHMEAFLDSLEAPVTVWPA